SIASDWARDNGMKYNVSKCAVVQSSTSSSFFLSGEQIPVASEYKYLGFPVTCHGIDFVQHVKTQVSSATSFLKFVQVQCSEWNPYTRYVIYNTFLRPKLEYGAPLTYEFQLFEKSKSLLQPVQKLQDEVVAWIFNSDIKKAKILHGILGALSIDQRFSHLHASFQLHLHQASSDNPIRPLISSSHSGQFVHSLPQCQLYNEFLTLPDLPATSELEKMKQSMSTFLLSRRSGILSQSKSILVNYIAPNSRMDSLVDKVLFSPAKYQRLFLAWRRGTLFLSTVCICGQRWHRGHIRCLSVPNLSEEQREGFLRGKEVMWKNYCEVYYLLIIQEWERTFEILNKWGRELDK